MLKTSKGVKRNPVAGINFPGFQRILDFTATGSEASKSVAVDGDTDKEYQIVIRNLHTTKNVLVTLNNDTGTNYGYQSLYNASGTIAALRATANLIMNSVTTGMSVGRLLTPAGFIKTCLFDFSRYSSGTTMAHYQANGFSWNNTDNVTSINFAMTDAVSFATGTRIIVYARRSQ